MAPRASLVSVAPGSRRIVSVPVRAAIRALLLAACGVFGAVPAIASGVSAQAVGEAAMATATAPATGLDVVLDSSQHWIGRNDVLMSVVDAAGTRLAERREPIVVELISPTGQVMRARPAIERFATYGRHLYRARVPLDEVGRWQLSVTTEDASAPRHGSTVLDVWPDGGTPALGAIAPAEATLTMRDARSMLHGITSDPEPLTAFYTWSLDEALREHQPTVLVLDSYAYRPNAACGGALGILHDVFIDYPGLVIIHAEPWRMAAGEDGMLRLDPPAGPAVLTDVSRTFGVEEPPWVFVIDRDGRLQAKFRGVVGSDELRAAMTSVTQWRPAA